MAFGKSNDVQDGPVRKYYTGVENFKVVGVNPTKAELETMYGREINYEPEYISENEVEDGDGKRTVKQIRLDFYLANEDNSITTKIQYYVSDTHHKSANNTYKVINDFGKSTWLSQEAVKTKMLPDNMSWYNASGVKVAKRGEEELISFLINLLNLPTKIEQLDDVSDAYAKISNEEWVKIFSGDVSLLREIIENTSNKVGVLLGVKTNSEGKLSQATYKNMVLRQYVLGSTRENRFSYLLKSLKNSKDYGAYGNVDFGDDNFILSEYSVTPTKISTENTNQEDIFSSAEPVEAFDDSDDWMN